MVIGKIYKGLGHGGVTVVRKCDQVGVKGI